jgi:predicted dienelactone hydrolase
MNSLVPRLLAVVAFLAIALLGPCAHAAGFQRGVAADPDGKPLEIGIWYPSLAPPARLAMGPTAMNVAVNAPLQGKDLPLVVISHGNGGYFLSHFDTAIALADAGFVVAAVTHTGDNYADQSRSTHVMERPRHVSRVLDHMLSTWEGRASINASRIGVFGFSSGGFTALVTVGGVPDFATIGPMCAQYPDDYACRLIARSGGNAPAPAPSATSSAADPRIKVAVVAAPALGFTFSPNGLRSVKVPIQLWRAEEDAVVPHPRYAEAVRLALPQPPDYRVVPRAGHYDFLAPCSDALAAVASLICTSVAGFDRAAFHATFNAGVVAFLGSLRR